MLIREGEARNLGIDIRLAALLAAVAGAVNAAGFQATGFFSANMTGNASALSDFLGLGALSPAAFFGALVVMFILGAFGSGLLIEAGRKRGVRAIYAYSITFEAILLMVFCAADILWPAFHENAGLIVCLSFVMGLQNAATTRISNARVRTTHVSGMATDIGLGLAALVSGTPDRDNAVMRLRLYGSAILAFLLGGVCGALLYIAVGSYVFLLAALVLLAIALPEVRRAQIPEPR
jgi:uncharacterized membrane protein YoaK (UPF0700 family)